MDAIREHGGQTQWCLLGPPEGLERRCGLRRSQPVQPTGEPLRKRLALGDPIEYSCEECVIIGPECHDRTEEDLAATTELELLFGDVETNPACIPHAREVNGNTVLEVLDIGESVARSRDRDSTPVP